jgi:LytS/YehU family sensor histidine kinase
LLAALVQVPIAIVVAEAFQLYEVWLAKSVFADAWLAPARAGGTLWLRFTRELLVYGLVLSVGAAVYSFLKAQSEERSAAELRVRAERLRAELAQAQLATLRSQLHPHFLFNALHAVGALVREQEPQRALQVLASIASLLRATLERSEAQETSLGEELELVERYLAIERVRFGERLRVAVDVEPDLRATRLPALLLLPMVENAIRHGLSTRSGAGHVELRARAAGESILIEIRDDGPGFPRSVLDGEATRPEQHFGLANSRRRLALLYGERQRMSLTNLPGGGARVAIELPAPVLSEATRA